MKSSRPPDRMARFLEAYVKFDSDNCSHMRKGASLTSEQIDDWVHANVVS